MVESNCFGVLLCGDITSDVALKSSGNEITRRLEIRLWLYRSIFWFRRLTKNRNVSNDGGYNDSCVDLRSGKQREPGKHSVADSRDRPSFASLRIVDKNPTAYHRTKRDSTA